MPYSGAHNVSHPRSFTTVTAEIKKKKCIYIHTQHVQASRWPKSSFTNIGAVYFICMVNNLCSFPSVIIGLTVCWKHGFSVLLKNQTIHIICIYVLTNIVPYTHISHHAYSTILTDTRTPSYIWTLYTDFMWSAGTAPIWCRRFWFLWNTTISIIKYRQSRI